MFAFRSPKHSARTTDRANRFIPEVQALEERQVLSVTLKFSAGVLRLEGNSSRDFISLANDGNGKHPRASEIEIRDLHLAGGDFSRAHRLLGRRRHTRIQLEAPRLPGRQCQA